MIDYLEDTSHGVLIRNDLGFYPQFHYLEKMHGNNIEDYTINQYEAICCAAEINDGRKVRDFNSGHSIESTEWTFTNSLDGSIIEHPASSQQPFIADEDSGLSDGYYGISFKYSLTDGAINETKLNSAFRIKSI